MISEAELHTALNALRHPEIQTHSLGELGIIQRVSVANNQVNAVLALPLRNAPVAQKLMDSVQQAIADIDAGLRVQVDLVKMTPEQRTNFMAVVKGDQSKRVTTNQVTCVIAVMSGKGGVGKSAVSGLLASVLRRRGLQIGILDADITGPSIPKIFGVNRPPVDGPKGIVPVKSRTGIKLMSINLLLPEEGQAVVWRGPLISRAIEQFWDEIAWGKLNYLIVDLPPGTSDAALTVVQSLPLHGVVLVTSPQDLAGMVVRKAANLIELTEAPLIGLIENMGAAVCPHCGNLISIFGPSHAEETSALIGTTLLGRLPLDANLATLCDAGAIEDYRSEAFDAIVENVLRRLPDLVIAN